MQKRCKNSEYEVGKTDEKYLESRAVVHLQTRKLRVIIETIGWLDLQTQKSKRGRRGETEEPFFFFLFLLPIWSLQVLACGFRDSFIHLLARQNDDGIN